MPNDSIPPCKCSCLSRWAKAEGSPIGFDPRLNEYYFVSATNHFLIYHCPFCGGRAPKSERAKLFAFVTESETKRLHALTQPLVSLEDVFKSFGQPDLDCPSGAEQEIPERDGRAAEVRTYRTLSYHGISDTADVQVLVDTERPDQDLQFTFWPKYLGPRVLRPQ